MVNYYKTLRVSSKASTAEIKSAYRRLARKLHPDLNKTSEKAAKDFADIAKAYEVLSNPQERAYYDTQMIRINTNGLIHQTDSVLYSANSHAQKLRQMAIERRYNEIVDQMMESELNETLAWQKVIFPMVALFVSTLFIGIFQPGFFEPNIWESGNVIGKLVLVVLAIVSVLHLVQRVNYGFERFTHNRNELHDSILDDSDSVIKPYSRFGAVAFLLSGLIVSLGIGFIAGNYLQMSHFSFVDLFYPHSFQPEALVYPPIVVLLVDIMHLVATKFEQQSL